MKPSPKLPCFAQTAPLFLIAGPCAIESRELVYEVAGQLKEICEQLNLPLIFKASYDKANRSSLSGARGVGKKRGLEILSDIRNEFNLPVLTDVHTPQEAEWVAPHVDVLQIPAFLCRQTDLIMACAKTGKPINIKKGQFLAPTDMQNVVDKAKSTDCGDILLCERGTMFGYHNLVVDMRALAWMADTGCPVVFDATHSAQLPGAQGDKTGGIREMVPLLARSAIAAGVQGIFIETHPAPEKAISDSATQWPLIDLKNLLEDLMAFETVAQARIKK